MTGTSRLRVALLVPRRYTNRIPTSSCSARCVARSSAPTPTQNAARAASVGLEVAEQLVELVRRRPGPSRRVLRRDFRHDGGDVARIAEFVRRAAGLAPAHLEGRAAGREGESQSGLVPSAARGRGARHELTPGPGLAA